MHQLDSHAAFPSEREPRQRRVHAAVCGEVDVEGIWRNRKRNLCLGPGTDTVESSGDTAGIAGPMRSTLTVSSSWAM